MKRADDLVGRQVAVAFDRQPRRSRTLVVHDEPDVDAAVIGRPPSLWLEDVVFVVGKQTCFVVGRVMTPRPVRVTSKTGWYELRVDQIEQGCFYAAHSGAAIRTAKYAHLEPGRIEAFGIDKGPPIHSLAEAVDPMPTLPILGPSRTAWRGEMGGLNYEPATVEETTAALQWAFETHPGTYIVDGADDWHAPDYVRPEIIVRRAGIVPVAWWHTGLSGLTKSGVVLTKRQYAQLRASFRNDYGCEIDAIPGVQVPSIARPPCGCWKGEGLQIYY